MDKRKSLNKKLSIVILRINSGDQGMFGALLIDKAFFSYTLEPPWRDNQKNISCIPEGLYHCSLTDSPRFGKAYQVEDVPGRTHILFHAGNFAGDKSKGFLSNSEGCILLGSTIAEMGDQQAVYNSRLTLSNFMDEMNGVSFALRIQNCFATEKED